LKIGLFSLTGSILYWTLDPFDWYDSMRGPRHEHVAHLAPGSVKNFEFPDSGQVSVTGSRT